MPLPPQAFVAQWATLHPLATAARRRELRPLQMLTELGETVALLQDSTRPLLQKASGGSYELGTSVRALTDLWRQRVPSATHQDVSVWDDVLCCRRRLLATLERKLEEELDGETFLHPAVDLSIHGIYILAQDDRRAVDGERFLNLRFTLPTGHPVNARGRVVQVDDHKGQRGIHLAFEEIADNDSAAIRAFVEAQQAA